MSVFNKMIHCGFIFHEKINVMHQDMKVMVIAMWNIVPKGTKRNDNIKNSEKNILFWVKMIKRPEYMPVCRQI